MKNAKSAWRKAAVIFLAVSILLAMSMVSFADTAAETSKTSTITVHNVESGATVTAYKVVKDVNGYWTAITDNQGNQLKVDQDGKVTLNSDDVTQLAQDIAGGDSGLASIELTGSGDSYTVSGAEPGLYLVLVSKTNSSKVYNPMIVAVNYDKDGNASAGSIDANSSFTDSAGNTAYAKSSTPSLTKSIIGKNGKTVDAVKGQTLNENGTTTFRISAVMPSYSKAYTNPTFSISDTVSEGITVDENSIAVKAGEEMLTKGTDYTITKGEGATFSVSFTEAYIRKGTAAREITVTYNGTLNSKAVSGFNKNTNTAKLTYSETVNSTNTKTDTTNHYTFDIDGDVYGQTEGHEFYKIKGGDGSIQTVDLITGKTEQALKGAQFALYPAEKDASGKIVKVENAAAVATGTSDEDGRVALKRLDTGYYILQETSAPSGYQLNSVEIPVEITASLNSADGTLTSYTVSINGQNTTYTLNNEGTVSTSDGSNGSAKTVTLENKESGLLPTTGGSGIYFYLIAGGLLIALAAVLYARNRRKQQ